MDTTQREINYTIDRIIARKWIIMDSIIDEISRANFLNGILPINNSIQFESELTERRQ